MISSLGFLRVRSPTPTAAPGSRSGDPGASQILSRPAGLLHAKFVTLLLLLLNEHVYLAHLFFSTLAIHHQTLLVDVIVALLSLIKLDCFFVFP